MMAFEPEARRTSTDAAWPDLPEAERGRRFQVWDYSPSHRTLLVRRPADDKLDTNCDLVFSGVARMSVATLMRLEHIDANPVRNGKRRLWDFVLSGGTERFDVRAERLRIESNFKPLFDALDDVSATGLEAARTFEIEVKTALVTSDVGEVLASSTHPRSPDFELRRGERTVWVDAIWTNERSVDRQVRNAAMHLAAPWGALPGSRRIPVVLVVGGLRIDEAVEQIAGVFSTVLANSQVVALPWDRLDGPPRLQLLLRRLLGDANQ